MAHLINRGARVHEGRCDAARQAEAAAFDSVWCFDHLLFREGDGPTEGFSESWTTLSAPAGATHRIELGTLVLCTAFRNPAVLAKMAATPDSISNGRLILGLGSGRHRPEFEVFGLDFDGRCSWVLDKVRAACADVGREPSSLGLTAGVHVVPLAETTATDPHRPVLTGEPADIEGVRRLPRPRCRTPRLQCSTRPRRGPHANARCQWCLRPCTPWMSRSSCAAGCTGPITTTRAPGRATPMCSWSGDRWTGCCWT
ncbi:MULTISPECIES: LLM class flavin-dependent oxidoreductase [Streptomyces]|uniref:LLM class flavin-dependent oxidoreductase n=1 Tax=Streptomyces herbicida TaxID=3065675 RepID=UPI0038CDAA3A